LELFGKKWNYLELYGIICELFGTTFGIIWNYFWNYWNYLELFGITFGITLINLTVIPNGITFGITWNYLENNSIFGITRLFFLVSCPSILTIDFLGCDLSLAVI
jgi:hypothetical protein